MKKLTILVLICLLAGYRPVFANTAATSEVTDSTELYFPDAIDFVATIQSTSIIKQVKLHYGTNQVTCGSVSAVAYPKIVPGNQVVAEWIWDMRMSGGEPPGASIWWKWEIIDDRGNSQFSDQYEVTWLDDIHPWKQLDEGLIRLHYYYDDGEYAQTLKNAAVAALNHLESDIGMIPSRPVDLYIYSDTQDMRDAVFYEPGWTGGLAYPNYNVVIIGITPGNLQWGKSTEAHELTHVLVGEYTFTCMGAIPTWLNEGLAVYGEGGPDSYQKIQFNKAVSADALLSFRVLSGGFSEDPNQADLSYSQSFYMVDYLIQTYGKDKILNLLMQIRDGVEIDEAIQIAYGFSLHDYENLWRSAYGLKPVERDSESRSLLPSLIPTIIPISGVSPVITDGQTVMATPTPTMAVDGGAKGVITPEPAESTQATPVPLWQRLMENVQKHYLLVICLVGANILLLVILLIAIFHKGGKK